MSKEQGSIYFRKQENWFKELLYKLKILKPKYKELSKVKEIILERSKENGIK